MAAVPATVSRSPVQTGPSYWWRSYQAMLRWEMTALRMWLPLIVLIQTFAGVGFVFGIALFFDSIPQTAALYVCTGVPVILMLMVGLMLGPQVVADQRTQGTYEFLQSLPVRRTASAMAWYTVTLAASKQ